MRSILSTPFVLIVAWTTFFASCNRAENNTGVEQTSVITETRDPLPSWNDGESKKAILDFVTKTTKEGSPDYIAPVDRIACFDNDGTLWCEQPYYFQLAFAMDQVQVMAPDHPEWKTKQPFKAILEKDVKALMAGGEKALFELVMTTHAGMPAEEFSQSVTKWISGAKHPQTGKPFTKMVYQPMLELLDYLRANGYKTFIVSGGGIDFMRPWAYATYGIPPDQVVGSSGKVKYEIVDGKPVIMKLPEINLIDDKEGKPVGIHQHIGKRPVITVGNSDGDYAMLQYTMTGEGPRFGMIIHHTDAEREYAYDRDSHIGQLSKGLDDAGKYGWKIVDMKNEWNRIFPD